MKGVKLTHAHPNFQLHQDFGPVVSLCNTVHINYPLVTFNRKLNEKLKVVKKEVGEICAASSQLSQDFEPVIKHVTLST